MKGLLTRSMDRQETIAIFYMDRTGKVTQRFVRVLKLDDKQLLAYCFYRKKVRTFRLERILSIGTGRRGSA